MKNIKDLVGDSATGNQGIKEIEQILELSEAAGVFEDRIIVSPSTVRGLGYYTGPVYEVELTEKIENEDGTVNEIGSVAGGGRYDDLIKRFTGQIIPATGFSLGVDRLLFALNQMKSKAETNEKNCRSYYSTFIC